MNLESYKKQLCKYCILTKFRMLSQVPRHSVEDSCFVFEQTSNPRRQVN